MKKKVEKQPSLDNYPLVYEVNKSPEVDGTWIPTGKNALINDTKGAKRERSKRKG